MTGLRAVIVLGAVLLLLALALAGPCRGPSEDVENLVAWMTGSFGSRAQAERDSSYFHITLEMAPIWRERDDGAWLYVEQAVASSRERPYRQRVYRVLEPSRGVFRSEVYALRDPLRFAGAWRDENPLAALSPDSLMLREGCAVILARDGTGRFSGSTAGTGCGSTLRGASHATSEVSVGPEGLTSWDRGFDANGEQVWGAVAGPYEFLRGD